MTKLIFPAYLLVVVGLFLYSYTQVDLNLTLSQISLWQIIQKKFQYIGWFQRPLSSVIYFSIVLLLTIFYIFFLWLSRKNLLEKRQFWKIVIFTSILLLFSYNAFSYDLFNYMFDAKIFTFYHADPFIHKALDYPTDPWITFMRWTHRTFPYGPVWLFITVPLSFLGFQFFLPTLFLFKALMVGSYLATIFFIGKISEKIYSDNGLFNMILFAFNPLVIIEGLVSAHNDIVMMAFSLSSLYLFLNKKYYRSLLLLLLSLGIKFGTVFIAPVYGVSFLANKFKRSVRPETMFLLLVLIMIVPVILASFRTNFQPWYFLYILPFASLIANRYYIFIPSILMSFFLLMMYLPFLYLGNWDNPVPEILFYLLVGSILISLILVLGKTVVCRSKRDGKIN